MTLKLLRDVLVKMNAAFMRIAIAPGFINTDFILQNNIKFKRILRSDFYNKLQMIFDGQIKSLEKGAQNSDSLMVQMLSMLTTLSAMSGSLFITNMMRIVNALNKVWDRSSDRYFERFVQFLDHDQLILLCSNDVFTDFQIIRDFRYNILLHLTKIDIVAEDELKIMAHYTDNDLIPELLRFMPYLISSDEYILNIANTCRNIDKYLKTIITLISNADSTRRSLVDGLFIKIFDDLDNLYCEAGNMNLVYAKIRD